jgi:hypothetical protein
MFLASKAHSAVTATHNLLLRPGLPYVPSSKAVCYRVVYFLITLKLFFSGVPIIEHLPKSCLTHFWYFFNFSNLLYILIYRSVQIIESSLQEVRLKPDVQESRRSSNLSNSNVVSFDLSVVPVILATDLDPIKSSVACSS